LRPIKYPIKVCGRFVLKGTRALDEERNKRGSYILDITYMYDPPIIHFSPLEPKYSSYLLDFIFYV